MRVIFVKTYFGDYMGLTIGKSYEVLNILPNTQRVDEWGSVRFLIVDDYGNKSWYTEPYVMEEKKSRCLKLRKLGEVVFNG